MIDDIRFIDRLASFQPFNSVPKHGSLNLKNQGFFFIDNASIEFAPKFKDLKQKCTFVYRLYEVGLLASN